MKAYFSCGAGDFIAIESFLDDAVKKQITEFWLVTRAAQTIEKLIRLHPYWKELPVFAPMTEKEIFSYGVYAFYDIEHLRRITKRNWQALSGAYDFSGEKLYPQILSGEIKYKESLFEVPENNRYAPNYTVIDAESNNDDRLNKRGRNLTKYEVQNVENKHRNIVRIGVGVTSLTDALIATKHCRHFYGVDSMMACFAARQTTIESITIKTVNPIYRKWQPIYDPFDRITILDNFNNI